MHELIASSGPHQNGYSTTGAATVTGIECVLCLFDLASGHIGNTTGMDMLLYHIQLHIRTIRIKSHPPVPSLRSRRAHPA